MKQVESKRLFDDDYDDNDPIDSRFTSVASASAEHTSSRSTGKHHSSQSSASRIVRSASSSRKSRDDAIASAKPYSRRSTDKQTLAAIASSSRATTSINAHRSAPASSSIQAFQALSDVSLHAYDKSFQRLFLLSYEPTNDATINALEYKLISLYHVCFDIAQKTSKRTLRWKTELINKNTIRSHKGLVEAEFEKARKQTIEINAMFAQQRDRFKLSSDLMHEINSLPMPRDQNVRNHDPNSAKYRSPPIPFYVTTRHAIVRLAFWAQQLQSYVVRCSAILDRIQLIEQHPSQLNLPNILPNSAPAAERNDILQQRESIVNLAVGMPPERYKLWKWQKECIDYHALNQKTV
jgi:hypothetical protein